MAPLVARAAFGLRLLRAAVFATACVALAAAGHTLASCAGVPLWALGVGGLAVLAVAVPLAGRERSLPGIAAGLAAGQLGLHALFGLGQHTASAVAVPGGATTGGISNGQLIGLASKLLCGEHRHALSAAEARQVVGDAGLDPATHSAVGAGATPTLPASLFPSLAMLLAHLLAALAAGWLLRRGEVALWRLVRLSSRGVATGWAEAALVRALRAALSLVLALSTGLPATGTRRGAARYAAERQASPGAAVLQHSVVRRGPPVSPVLAA